MGMHMQLQWKAQQNQTLLIVVSLSKISKSIPNSVSNVKQWEMLFDIILAV